MSFATSSRRSSRSGGCPTASSSSLRYRRPPSASSARPHCASSSRNRRLPRRRSLRLGDLDELLAAVLTAEHAHERLWCVLEAFNHILGRADAAVREPLRQPWQRFAEAMGVVADQESLHSRAEDDQRARPEGRPWAFEVVLRY